MKRDADTADRGSDIDEDRGSDKEDRGSDIANTDKELEDESLKSSKQKETA